MKSRMGSSVCIKKRVCFKTCRYRVAREPCHSERSEESQSGGYQMPEIPRRYAPRNDTLGCYPVLNHAGIIYHDPGNVLALLRQPERPNHGVQARPKIHPCRSGAHCHLGETLVARRTLVRVRRGMTPLTIGIPRALYYFYYPALWETFFHRLGMKVLVSDASTGRTIEQAALISESEHCLPLKLLDAHLAQVVDKVDLLFVPRILSGLKGHICLLY